MAEKKLSTVEQIQSLKNQIKQLSESLKTDLAKQLETARQTYEEIINSGQTHKSIFSDPQFMEVVVAFKIQTEEQQPALRRTMTRGPRQKGNCTTEEAIVQALADGKSKSIDELVKKATEIKGVSVSRGSVNGTLQTLKKDNKAKSVGRGEYQKA